MTLYDLAMSAFKDAANRSMRRGGRKVWNVDDYNAGVAEFNRLLPEPEMGQARVMWGR